MSDTTKKPEKIASAIYLITGFFADQEPLKWGLRTLVSRFISLNVSLNDHALKGSGQIKIEIRMIVLELISLLSVAKNAGLISDLNHSLVDQELNKYIDTLGLPDGMQESNGQVVISANMFALEAPTAESTVPNTVAPSNSRVAPTHHKPAPVEQESTDLLPDIQKSLPEVNKGQKAPSNLKTFGAVSVKKQSRQSIIINLLKRKKEIMIKDVSPLIRGCSEKTIQRELLAMVKAGILNKIGEKRWSRYTLA